MRKTYVQLEEANERLEKEVTVQQSALKRLVDFIRSPHNDLPQQDVDDLLGDILEQAKDILEKNTDE